jgi:hypothetical protein
MTVLTPSVPWLIDAGGVGALRLGQPLPAALVDGELERGYVAGYLGDGVAYDGFRLEHPPLTVILSRGPFEELDRRDHEGAPPLDVLRPRALAAVREGATVRALLVHGRGLATAGGLGVGSTLAELERAYPDLRVSPVPPTAGGDRAVATSRSQPGLAFFFADFDAAHVGGPVTRVDVRIPDA